MGVVAIERGDQYGELEPLDALAPAMEKCTKEIHEALSDPEDEVGYWAILDDTGRRLEDLLGLSLVACQVEIDGVVSLINKLHECHTEQLGLPISNLSCKREALLQRHSPLLGSTDYSSLTAIDAFANYFKHRHEWNLNWSSLTSRSTQTIKIITALGAGPMVPPDNLRKGYRVIFGDENYGQLKSRFRKILHDWTLSLKNEYRRELSLSQYCD